jgi:hypothetical protein
MDATLIFWLIEEVGLPLAKDLYETWTNDGKNSLEEIKKIKEEGLPDWPDLKAGTSLDGS